MGDLRDGRGGASPLGGRWVVGGDDGQFHQGQLPCLIAWFTFGLETLVRATQYNSVLI